MRYVLSHSKGIIYEYYNLASYWCTCWIYRKQDYENEKCFLGYMLIGIIGGVVGGWVLNGHFNMNSAIDRTIDKKIVIF